MERLVSPKRESIDLVHDEEVEITLVAEELMGSKNDDVASQFFMVPAIDGNAFVVRKCLLYPREELDHDIAAREGEANLSSPRKGGSYDPIGQLRLPSPANGMDQCVFSDYEIRNQAI